MIASKKVERSVIKKVSIGSILEWYEMFLFIYWSDIISKLFFNTTSEIIGLLHSLGIFAVGFLARPFGGLIFGYLGDRFGRKESFIWSIILITLPTSLIGFIQPYSSWGVAAPISLLILRLMQGIPAGGELPGAMCYLYESASKNRKKFVTSFSFVGPQIGGILGMIECLLLEEFLPHDFLVSWGWRISFFVGGILGLLGFLLRRDLKESPEFEHLKEEKKVLLSPIKQSFLCYQKQMAMAFFVSIFEVVGYFMIAVFPVIYFEEIFGIEGTTNLITLTILLIISVVTIPLFGKIGDKYNSKNLLMFSAIAIIILAFPYYYTIKHLSFIPAILMKLLFIMILNIQFALLPSFIAELFPPPVRYTCLGFSFNLCDSLIGGVTPIFALYLVYKTGNLASFVVIFVIAAFISLFAIAMHKYRGWAKS